MKSEFLLLSQTKKNWRNGQNYIRQMKGALRLVSIQNRKEMKLLPVQIHRFPPQINWFSLKLNWLPVQIYQFAPQVNWFPFKIKRKWIDFLSNANVVSSFWAWGGKRRKQIRLAQKSKNKKDFVCTVLVCTIWIRLVGGVGGKIWQGYKLLWCQFTTNLLQRSTERKFPNMIFLSTIILFYVF